MAKLEAKHYKYLKNDEFLERYMTLLQNRLTYSNNKLEEDVQWIKNLFENESEKELTALDRKIEEYEKQYERARLL